VISWIFPEFSKKMTTITPITRTVNSSGLKATTGIIFYEGFIQGDFLMMTSNLLNLKNNFKSNSYNFKQISYLLKITTSPNICMAFSSKGDANMSLKAVSQYIPIFQYFFTFFPSISMNS
jgi:hypothetical protein